MLKSFQSNGYTQETNITTSEKVLLKILPIEWLQVFNEQTQKGIINESSPFPALSAPLIVKTYVICLFAARKCLLFGMFLSWYSTASITNLLLTEFI